MIEEKEVKKIKETVKDFFEKMTISVSEINVELSLEKDITGVDRDVVSLDIKLDEPQILIGQGGQTLFETQRLLRTILNKGIGNNFLFNLDINDYKKQKIEYLKSLAKSLADQASLTKEEKVLAPMSAYERRIVHAELAQRSDIITESQGEGPDRHIVIKVK